MFMGIDPKYEKKSNQGQRQIGRDILTLRQDILKDGEIDRFNIDILKIRKIHKGMVHADRLQDKHTQRPSLKRGSFAVNPEKRDHIFIQDLRLGRYQIYVVEKSGKILVLF